MKTRLEKRTAKFKALNKKIEACHKCAISKRITNKVFGTGSVTGKLVFVGEAPGYDEDKKGKPFVGKAGKKLRRAIEVAGGLPDEYCILNILKCRPPKNRNPKKKEIRNCTKWLDKQINILKPNLVVPLGGFAAQYFLNTEIGILKLRGKMRIRGRLRIFPMVHPAWVLRNNDQETNDDFIENMHKAFELAREKPDEGRSWYTYLKRRETPQEEKEKEEKQEKSKSKRQKKKGSRKRTA